MRCPLIQRECLKDDCAWWMDEIEFPSTGNPMIDDTMKRMMSAAGYKDGKIPAMCSIKYRSMK